ncbi:hypothetical protein D3C76_1639280 [compost metagenome]
MAGMMVVMLVFLWRIFANTTTFYIVTRTVCKKLFFKNWHFMLHPLNRFLACLKSFTAMGCISNRNNGCLTYIQMTNPMNDPHIRYLILFLNFQFNFTYHFFRKWLI